MSKIVAIPVRPSRLSPKLRRAIDLRVRNGLTISEACGEAGLSTAGWYKAMQRPAVRDHLEDVQRKFIGETEGLRALAKVRALHMALDLLGTTTNEQIKCRLIEFLAGEGKSPQVAVNVDARNMHAGGYAYPADLMAGTQAKVVGDE